MLHHILHYVFCDVSFWLCSISCYLFFQLFNSILLVAILFFWLYPLTCSGFEFQPNFWILFDIILIFLLVQVIFLLVIGLILCWRRLNNFNLWELTYIKFSFFVFSNNVRLNQCRSIHIVFISKMSKYLWTLSEPMTAPDHYARERLLPSMNFDKYDGIVAI